MKSKVLLVTPNLKGIENGVNRICPSLGLMLIAQPLLNAGHEVKIHDTALEGWGNRKLLDKKNKIVLIGQSNDEIATTISNFSPDIIAISVLFSNLLGSAHDIAKIAKKINKKTIVILGGNHISNAVIDYKYALKNKKLGLPDYIEDLENNNIDFAMTGEGEFSMLQLINSISEKKDISNIPGLVKKIDNKKYIINPSDRILNLDLISRPARHLVNMEGYFKIGAFHSAKSRSNRVLSVMCSRGCPEKCTFCTTPEMWGQNTRWRSTSHIMDEITNDVKNFNIGEIQFDDDTLTVNIKNLYSLCNELEKVGLPWCTPNGTKVNYHLREQPSMYKAMVDAGCYQITLACESASQRVLDQLINKRLPKETIIPAIENAKNAGLLVHTFWILGYPGETKEEMEETIEFAMSCGADSFSFSILSPLPGSPVYRQVLQENLWWNGRGLKDMLFRSSLIKVDGFSNPDDFEKYVDDTNIKANLLLKENNPKRFELKYGKGASEASLLHQT